MQFDLLGKAVRRFRLPTVDYVSAPVIVVPVQEGDVNSRYFEITLYDDHGDMDLSIYTKVMLSGTTPSGVTLTSTKCELSEDKKTVIVQFGGGFTARAGRVACNITFTNTDSTVSLTSQTFHVIVSESATGKIITENDDDYNELLALLKEVGALESSIDSAEKARVAAENKRVEEETKRDTAEKSRASAESTRASQETTRQSNEEAREDNEDDRQTAETARANAETARASAEASRVTVEQQRVSDETARATAETTRQSNETTRQQNETARVNAETARAAAETQRETDFQTAKGNCEDATQDANDAAQDVRDLLNALPCPTNKIDGDTTTAIGELRFIALED